MACGDSLQNPAASITIAAVPAAPEPGDTVLVHLSARAGPTNPFPNVELALSVTGGGHVTPERVVTDRNGVASVQWFLAPTEDGQSLRVEPSAALLTLVPRWKVRAVEIDTSGLTLLVDSAAVRVTVLNRAGQIIEREVTTSITSTPDFSGVAVASLEHGMLFAEGPGSVTLNVTSEGVSAAPVRLRVAPRVAVLGSFDQSAPAASGDTIVARGYRLDLADDLTIGGAHVETSLIDSATLRVVLPAIDATPCRGGAYVPAILGRGFVGTPGVRVRRDGELTLAPGELVRLGVARAGCVRLAPIPGAEYALMYFDSRPIVAAGQASFPDYGSEHFNFAVAFDAWGNGPTMSARAPHAPPLQPTESAAADVKRLPRAATAPPADAIELRTTPWQVGDRASVLMLSGYESGTIARVSDPFVVLELDNQPISAQQWAEFDQTLSDVQREAVPVLRAALSPRTPYTTAGSGQFVIVLGVYGPYYSGVFVGNTVIIQPSQTSSLYVFAHELAHAWQDLFNRDNCDQDQPWACWTGSTWAVEGGADYLANEALRRKAGGPLTGAPEPVVYWNCCSVPLLSLWFNYGYVNSSWFLRDQVARAVVAGADYESALAAVSRGALEGWYGLAPQRPAGAAPRGGLAARLTTLLGTAWNPLDAFEASVWSLGMDESPAPDVYQYPAYTDYHYGIVGIIQAGTALAGTIEGDTFGHVELEDGGAGGAYRFNVAADGFVWAVGRVR